MNQAAYVDAEAMCENCGHEFADHVENPECEMCGLPGLSHELAEDRAGVYRQCGFDGYYEPSEERQYICPDKRDWFESAPRTGAET